MSFCYILGNPRSGTSLFRLMLNAHPEMVAPPECGFIQWNHDLFKAADFKDSDQRKAFAKAVRKNKNLQLQIVGKGMDQKRLEKLIESLGMLPYIKMLGKVSLDEYKRLMQESDIVVNPCLKEGAVTTAFDSMSLGKPLICLDTSGYSRYFSNEYAIVIPKLKRTETILKLTQAILNLTDLTKRNDLGENAQRMGEKFTWENRGKDIYKTITTNYKAWCSSD